jgi:GNAT superfamily N-acetyltransferase
MFIRPPKYREIEFCAGLVAENWGIEAADRCHLQMVEYFRGGHFAPTFGIMDLGDPLSRDYVPMPIGFAAFGPSMLMKGAFNLIWIAVHPTYQGSGAGKALVEWRIDEIGKRDGQMITLMTQKPDYFSKFGFFKLHHVGNEWYLMLKLLKTVEM